MLLSLSAACDKAKPEFLRCAALQAKGDLRGATAACKAAIQVDPATASGIAAAEKLVVIKQAQDEIEAAQKRKAEAERKAAEESQRQAEQAAAERREAEAQELRRAADAEGTVSEVNAIIGTLSRGVHGANEACAAIRGGHWMPLSTVPPGVYPPPAMRWAVCVDQKGRGAFMMNWYTYEYETMIERPTLKHSRLLTAFGEPEQSGRTKDGAMVSVWGLSDGHVRLQHTKKSGASNAVRISLLE